MEVEKNDGYAHPVYNEKETENSFMKVYGDAKKKLINVHGCPRNLIEYLGENMGKNNIVYMNAYSRLDFVKWIEKNSDGKTTYSDINVRMALRTLKDNDLIFPVSRGVYQVNPEYFWKGNNEKHREELIKGNLENGYGRE